MSSAELSAPRGGSLAHPRLRSRAAVPEAPIATLGLLGLVTLWAAFDHGAVDEAASARVEVAITIIAMLGAGAALWTGRLRLGPRRAGIGLALLAGFCVWSALSVIWSVDADRTWIELNRCLMYLLVVALAIGCGASWRRAPEALSRALIIIGALVALYALGEKLAPGLRIGGLVDLDQTGAIPRLQEPLGYWNALA